MGSGKWRRFRKKSTVEESIALGIRDFDKRIYPRSAGKFTWTGFGGNKFSVRYSMTWASAPTIIFHYRFLDREDINIPIRLDTTLTQFGGERWWFVCPLIANGAACNRRAGKLYLPPGSRYFGCRRCHALTYQSCQEAHQEERGTGTIEYLEKWMETLMERQGNS